VIPRFKSALGWPECFAALRPSRADAVEQFERAFAKELGIPHAVAFAYGRTALWAMLKALGIEGAEVIIPAYTCVVVAHATVESGNHPVFVDITERDFNMDIDLLADAFTERTRMVIPTHLFGYPMDTDRVAKLVQDAEKRYGHRIWVLQDCAHSFDAGIEGQRACLAGDAALFAFNIAKYMTAIGGGMIATGDAELADKLRDYREAHCHRSPWCKPWERRAYCIAAMAAFSNLGYGLTWRLEHRTALLDSEVKYYNEKTIELPKDFLRLMTPVEAAVGCVQLRRLRQFEARRRSIARRYHEALADVGHLAMPPLQEGATYSHFVALLAPDIRRDEYVSFMARRGIDFGCVIQYSVPHMAAYEKLIGPPAHPVARKASERIINLPISAVLSDRAVDRVIAAVREYDGSLLA